VAGGAAVWAGDFGGGGRGALSRPGRIAFSCAAKRVLRRIRDTPSEAVRGASTSSA
jgi:hypothetical protein